MNAINRVKKYPNKRRNLIVLLFSYIAVFLMIAITRGSIPYTYHSKAWLLLFVFSTFIVRCNGLRLKRHASFLYLISISSLMVLTSLYNSSFDTDFILFIFYGILSYIIIGSLTLNEFKHYFLNIVVFISILSLTIFTLSFFVSLPLKYMENEYVKIGYFMFQAIEWNNEPLGRNTGIFTEPGCFQYCLNYTLLLFLEDIINKKVNRITKIKLSIVVVALITCASTSGFIVLMCLIAYLIFSRYKRSLLKMIFIGVPIALIAIGAIYSSEMVGEKLDEDNKNRSVIMRTADALAMSEMILDHPFVGNGGVGTKKYKNRVLGYGAMSADHGATNGVLVAMAVLGVVWLPLYCYFCGKACKCMFPTVPSWLFVILTLLIHSNEYFIFSPIVYIFIFSYNVKRDVRLEVARANKSVDNRLQ